MRRVLWLLFCVVLCCLMTGCGHGILIESETTGFAVSIPIGESTPLNITVGMTKTVTATVRGGTEVETTSVAGGGIFSGDGGIGKKTVMRTNAQLNEGNLRDVLTSSSCPENVKIVLASNLVAAASAPVSDPMVIQTTTATIHTGSESVLSNNVAKIDRVSGIDKIAETVPQVTTPIVESTANVVNHTLDTTTTVTTTVFDKLADMCRSIKWSFLFKALCAIASVVGLWLWLNRSKKTKPLPVLDEVDPNLAGAPVVPEHKPTVPTESDTIDVPIIVKDDKKQTPKGGTVAKKGIFSMLISAIVAIVNILMKIPPETWKKIAATVKGWFKKKKK